MNTSQALGRFILSPITMILIMGQVVVWLFG